MNRAAEAMPDGAPKKERKPREDLQKEYNRLVKEGSLSGAAEFLRDNKDGNPRYAEKAAGRILVKAHEKINEANDRMQMDLKRSSALQLVTYLYGQYKYTLSERKKSKVGFKEYVKNYLNSMQEEQRFTPEEEEYNELVLAQVEDQVEGEFESFEGKEYFVHTDRTFYKGRAERAAKQTHQTQDAFADAEKAIHVAADFFPDDEE